MEARIATVLNNLRLHLSFAEMCLYRDNTSLQCGTEELVHASRSRRCTRWGHCTHTHMNSHINIMHTHAHTDTDTQEQKEIEMYKNKSVISVQRDAKVCCSQHSGPRGRGVGVHVRYKKKKSGTPPCGVAARNVEATVVRDLGRRLHHHVSSQSSWCWSTDI